MPAGGKPYSKPMKPKAKMARKASPPKVKRPPRDMTPKDAPMPGRAMPTQDMRAWHSMPFAERLKILQSGQGVPSFINPGTIAARIGWLQRLSEPGSNVPPLPALPMSPEKKRRKK